MGCDPRRERKSKRVKGAEAKKEAKKAKKAKKEAKGKEKEKEKEEEEEENEDGGQVGSSSAAPGTGTSNAQEQNTTTPTEEDTTLYTADDRKRVAADESYRPDLKKHSDQKTFVGGGAFNRDLARVIHSASFRRLRNKAQLFPTTESDAFRTRLTHSLEVSQIAQGLAKQAAAEHEELKPISLDLINMAALAHDIGHPPFGHNGERALNDWMKKAGGFEGNAQNLRVLARLEKKRTPHGLNLTYRCTTPTR